MEGMYAAGEMNIKLLSQCECILWDSGKQAIPSFSATRNVPQKLFSFFLF